MELLDRYLQAVRFWLPRAHDRKPTEWRGSTGLANAMTVHRCRVKLSRPETIPCDTTYVGPHGM
jgi:hypothetical protein